MTKVKNVTSRDNSLLRLARATRDGKNDKLIFVEGLRLCEEALRSRLEIKAVIFSDEIARKERAASFLREAEPESEQMIEVSEKLLATVSYTKTPQGVIVIARRPLSGLERLEALGSNPLLVLLHGINNPVNVGAILRSAEAAGLHGVIATAQTSDPYSPKSLRGAMGSAFRLPIWFGPSYATAIDWCQQQGIAVICATLDGETPYTAVDWSSGSALVVGREASGLTAEEVALAAMRIRIPMQGAVESLNVAVATGIVLYEAARQRS